MHKTVQCPECHHSSSEAWWRDLFKSGDKVVYVAGYVSFDGDAYDLDSLLDILAEKGLTEDEIDYGDFLSMTSDTELFTREDIIQMDFGLEDAGAYCTECNSAL